MEMIDINRMKILRDKTVITEDEYYDEIMASVNIFLQTKMHLQILSIEGNGQFGEVIAKRVNCTEELSINVVAKEIARKNQIEDWPKLKHQNILKLLHTQYIPQLEVHIFATYNHPFCLECYLEEEEFINNPAALQQIEKWLTEILDALEYLHSKNYCHLSLMIDRILISANSTALLSHFCCLDSTNLPSNTYDVQHVYKPPETYFTLYRNLKMAVDGVSFDIWCFGALALQMFTGSFIEENVPNEYTNWRNEIYPLLFTVLQENTFTECLKKTFPAVRVEKETVEIIINLVTSCMRILPEDRPSTRLLKCHKYFRYDGYLPTDEDVWNTKGGENTVQIIKCPSFEDAQLLLEITQNFPPDKTTVKKKSPELIEGPSDISIEDAELLREIAQNFPPDKSRVKKQSLELIEGPSDISIEDAELLREIAQNFPPDKTRVKKQSPELIESSSDINSTENKNHVNEHDQTETDEIETNEVVQPAKISMSIEQEDLHQRNENEYNSKYISVNESGEAIQNSKALWHVEQASSPESDNGGFMKINMGMALDNLDPDYIREFLRCTKPKFYTIVRSGNDMESKLPGKFSRWISYEKIYLDQTPLIKQPRNFTCDPSLILSDLEDDCEQLTQPQVKNDSLNIDRTEDLNNLITAETNVSISSQSCNKPCDGKSDGIQPKVSTSKKKKKNPAPSFLGWIRSCCMAPFACCRRKTDADD